MASGTSPPWLLQASRAQQGAHRPRHRPWPESLPPYIEASNARINFKYGNEKLPFSFLNADVSIWLENPNQWQLRFAAQPIRTDINLSLADSGLGSRQRAASIAPPLPMSLPLDLKAEWRGAPARPGHPYARRPRPRLGAATAALPPTSRACPTRSPSQLSAAAADFHRESFEPAPPAQPSRHLQLRHIVTPLASLDGIPASPHWQRQPPSQRRGPARSRPPILSPISSSSPPASPPTRCSICCAIPAATSTPTRPSAAASTGELTYARQPAPRLPARPCPRT